MTFVLTFVKSPFIPRMNSWAFCARFCKLVDKSDLARQTARMANKEIEIDFAGSDCWRFICLGCGIPIHVFFPKGSPPLKQEDAFCSDCEDNALAYCMRESSLLKAIVKKPDLLDQLLPFPRTNPIIHYGARSKKL